MSEARILIVVPDPVEALDLQQRLTALGYPPPEIVHSAEEGITRAETSRPDLVLMDIRMPEELDGIAAAKRIRSGLDVPVIFLTASSDEEAPGRAKVSGPYGYIVKPIQDRELHTTVETALFRHEAERKIQRAEERFRSLVEKSTDGIYRTDAGGRFVEVNPAGAAMLGYTIEELLRLSVMDLLAPEDVTRFSGTLADTAKGEASITAGRFRRKDGSEFTGELVMWQLPDGHVQVILRDRGARDRAEAALRQSEQRLRLAQAAGRVGTFEWNVQTGVNEWSPELEAMYGLNPGEFGRTQANWEQLVYVEDRAAALGLVERALDTFEPVEGEWRVALPNGELRWLAGRFQAFRDASGKLERLIGVNFDITARKQAEEELRRHRDHLEEMIAERTAALEESRNQLRQFSDVTMNMQSALYIFRMDDLADPRSFRIVFANPAVQMLTGVEPATVTGKRLSEAFPEIYDTGLPRIYAGVVRDDRPADLGVIHYESARVRPGEYRLRAFPLPGQCLGVIFDNVTDEVRESYVREGMSLLGARTRGSQSVQVLANAVVECLAEYVGAPTAALYLVENRGVRLTGRYAYRVCEGVPEVFALGEGLVGQAAASGKTLRLDEVPANYVLVGSGLGQTPPRHILVLPFRFGEEVKGVIELARLAPFSSQQLAFLDRTLDAIGIAVHTAQANARTLELLAESQQQAEELRTQQEELRATNEELEQQSQLLRQSEERLRAQQEELQAANEELEEKNGLLARQKREVEKARKDQAAKAEELALASTYKSEFLANMSHELRTPLNSLLLLAQSLARNQDGNLTAEQVESAKIIYGSGSDLLSLINEILDLSKIEAGRMELHLAPVPVAGVAAGLRAAFGHVARDKGLTLDVLVRDDAPAEILTDRQRLEQILRNLVSNAIKFSECGGVTVTFGRAADEGLPLFIAVSDTGIGIAPEHRRRIFEAFQQADGSTARRYGGTGLGLSIARELTNLLGGRLDLKSAPGEGSTFTLLLPLECSRARARVEPEPSPARVPPREPPVPRPLSTIEDDRDGLAPGDRVILIVEDDPNFARILLERCHERGLKALVAPTGETALELTALHLPAGVLLDLRLPGMDGWAVLSALKESTRTRHIPVHVLSVINAPTEARRKGAVGFALKPLSEEDLDLAFRRLEIAGPGEGKRVLVVEADSETRRRIVTLIGNGDVTVDEAASAREAREALGSGRHDCLVLDLELPDQDGTELLAGLRQDGVLLPPVVIHTARALSEDQEQQLREYGESIVIKTARSHERLLDEVSLFLHRVVSRLPEKQRELIATLHDSDSPLRGKTVLVVDDDMRTTFAVSRLLAEHGVTPLKAENGERALRLLAEHPDVDLVLMDIMMPVMDGYEAMRRIRDSRSGSHNHRVPIIVLTAKAMPEDRQRCVEAGADDYLAKPLDEARLLSMVRVWLYR